MQSDKELIERLASVLAACEGVSQPGPGYLHDAEVLIARLADDGLCLSELTRQTEEEAIVAYFREQAATWERLSRKSEARGPEYVGITNSQAGIAASYADHADAIERGDHRLGK